MKPFLILSTILVVLAALGGNVLLVHAAIQTTDGQCPVTWKSVDVPQVGNLHAVTAIAADNIWAAGDGDLLHWNGQSWATVPNPIGKPIARLAGLPNGDLWASNQDTVMHWDGKQWEQVGDKTTFRILDIAVLAPDDIWATSGGAEHWDGSHWTHFPLSNDFDPAFTRITALAPDKIWVVGFAGHVLEALAYSWDGKQWTQESVWLNPESVYQGVSASSMDDVWVIGKEGYQIAQQFDGTNWVRHDPTGYYMYDIRALAPDDVYGVSNEILHWDGNAWSVLFASDNVLEAISASSATDLWAVGGGVVMHGTPPCATPLTPTPTTEPPTPAPTATKEACAVTPPQLLAPQNQAATKKAHVSLTWQPQDCAKTYQVVLRAGSIHGTKVAQKEVAKPRYKTAPLTNGVNYYWHVRACNASHCSQWSEWRSFTIQP